MKFKKNDKVYVKAISTSYDGKYRGSVGTVTYVYGDAADQKIGVSLQSHFNTESKYGWFYFHTNELEHCIAAGDYSVTAAKQELNKKYGYPFSIKDVIFNDPAVIILWNDGTKTVVKCSENDIFDPEKGLAMAISKKALGNQGKYYETFKKYLPEEEDVDDVGVHPFITLGDMREKAFITLGDMCKEVEDNMRDLTDSLKKQTVAYDEPYYCATCKYLCQPLESTTCYGCKFYPGKSESDNEKGESK